MKKVNFTRAHYIFIASVIKSDKAESVRPALAYWFASAFRRNDEKFDTDKFLDACGL